MTNTKTVYILHHKDSDGRFAGWSGWRHFMDKGITPIMLPVQYGEEFPIHSYNLQPDDEVYIVDFSYKRDILKKVSSLVGKLVVLDHHKTALEELSGIELELNPLCDNTIVFDMTKSGALLAWEYFFPEKKHEPIRLCQLVNDRDLWLYEFGDDTRALESYIRTQPKPDNMEFWNDLATNHEFFNHALSLGHAYLTYERLVIASFVRSSRNYEIVEVNYNGKKLKCCIYEGMGILHSELAEAFYTSPAHDLDFTLEWRRKDKNLVTFSLRSNKIDVSELAVTMGGGGHKAAAGFACDLAIGFITVSKIYDGGYIFPYIPENAILN